jgi:hypothetical protein
MPSTNASNLPDTTPGSADKLKPAFEKVKAHWHEYDGATLTNRTGGGLVAGDVVALSTADDASVILTDTAGSRRQYVVARATIANAAAGEFGRAGTMSVKAQGAVARGAFVQKSATTKAVETTGIVMPETPPVGALGVALAAAAGGFVTVIWFDQPIVPRKVVGARVRHASAQTVSGAGSLALAFTAELWDTHSHHDTGSNTSRLTCVIPGVYVITGHVQWEVPGSGDTHREVFIRLNGATDIARQSGIAEVAGDTLRQSISTIYDMAAGDYVELVAVNGNASAQDVTVQANRSPELAFALLGGRP